MGAKLSISNVNTGEDEEMRRVILKLAKDRFEEFKEAVLADYRLREKFKHATNN
jgi:hypothetical protein